MSPGSSSPKLSRGVALGWLAAVGAALALAPFASFLVRHLPPCPLRAAVGIPCPACGSGRALAALTALDPLAALAWNPLAALGALGFATLGVAAAAGELGGRPLVEPRALGGRARAAIILALAANWLYLAWSGR